MAVILLPAIGEDLMINQWNWRPIVSLLVRRGILPDGEREERCLANGCGGFLSESEAIRAAGAIELLLAAMRPEDRLLIDGSLTDLPKAYDQPVSDWDDSEVWNRYSTRYDILLNFAEFCRRSGGFTVI